MKKLFAFLLLLPVVFAEAQKKSNAQKFANTITADDLKKHLYIVAGKEMEGRDTPSPGLEKAAEYIENHFRSLGLLPGNGDNYRQVYPLYKDSMTTTSLKVNDVSLELTKDFQPNTSNYTAEMRFSEVVFVKYGIVDSNINDYKDLDVSGRLVLMLDGSPANYKPAISGFASPVNAFTKLRKAREKGAAAVIMIDNSYPRNRFNIPSRYSLNNYQESLLPLGFSASQHVAEKILGEDGKDILEKMKAAPLSSKIYKANVELTFYKNSSTAYASNVLGAIEGSDKKNEWVIITAHYDHVGKRGDSVIFYGADDDGSGTVSILELAEAYSKAKAEGKGPRRSILFMTVSGEEKGLWGSEYYANHPVFPLEKTTVNLNIDMIGRIDPKRKEGDSTNYVYVVGDDKLSSDLRPISEGANKSYTKLELDYKFNDPDDKERIYYRSDHYNFARKGVPIIFYFNGTHADYHRPTDTPDKINYQLMAKRAQFVFHTAWEMANRNDMLKRDIPLAKPF